MGLACGLYTIAATIGIKIPRYAYCVWSSHPGYTVCSILHWKHALYQVYWICRRTWSIHCRAA